MQKHGHYHIEVIGNILISQFYGAWNYEQTKAYQQQVKLEAADIITSPWARIVDLSQWEGGGEETIAPLIMLQKWSEQHNCQLVVFVNPPLVPAFMLEKYGDPYGDYKVVGSTAEAISWAKSCLAK